MLDLLNGMPCLVQVERKDIAETQVLPISLMPEGLLPAMTEEQVRNLFAYLMSSGQVDLPAINK